MKNTTKQQTSFPFKIEFHHETKTPIYWHQQSHKQYFNKLNKHIDRLIKRGKKTFKLPEHLET